MLPVIVVLVVSDTAASVASADLTGPALSTYLSNTGSFNVQHTEIVPDEVQRIRQAVSRWSDPEAGVDIILTAGGTGFGPRDRTPEAVGPLLDRLAPGIVHAMLAASLAVTPFGSLARPIAGIRNRTLIITLPGSPKAATENLAAIQTILGHGIKLLRGLEDQAVHESLGAPSNSQRIALQQHAEGHQCQSHSHKLCAGVRDITGQPSITGRHRVSPYPIISLEQAFEALFDATTVMPAEEWPVEASLISRIVAEDVCAPHDIPSSLSTNVDGYAAIAPIGAGTYPVMTASSLAPNQPLPPRNLFRINTGALLPLSANTVIMVEDTVLAETVPSTQGATVVEEAHVTTLVDAPVNSHVRLAGSDVRCGELVLPIGQMIGASGGEIGSLAFVGRRNVKVTKLPRIAVLSTGSELIDVHDPSGAESNGKSPGYKVFDCNRPAMIAALVANQFKVADEGIVKDSYATLAEKLQNLVQRFDVIITSGGTSMGEADLLKPVIEQVLNGRILFGRVAVKPGKPTTVAVVPRNQPNETASSGSCLIFALPGNPASCLVTLHVFVLPALRKLAGFDKKFWHLPTLPVKVAREVPLDSRPEFQRAYVNRVITESGESEFIGVATGNQRSSRAISLVSANVLLRLPAATVDQPVLAAGSTIQATILGPVY